LLPASELQPRPPPRYLDNIHLHPEEERYRKIKLQNKVFQVGCFLMPAYLVGVCAHSGCMEFGLPAEGGRVIASPRVNGQ
jgi:hypothetical protein